MNSNGYTNPLVDLKTSKLIHDKSDQIFEIVPVLNFQEIEKFNQILEEQPDLKKLVNFQPIYHNHFFLGHFIVQ